MINVRDGQSTKAHRASTRRALFDPCFRRVPTYRQAGERMRHRHNQPWTADDDVALITLWSLGTVARVARDLGRSQKAVTSRAVRLGLKREG